MGDNTIRPTVAKSLAPGGLPRSGVLVIDGAVNSSLAVVGVPLTRGDVEMQLN